jgi:hypothetical protein
MELKFGYVVLCPMYSLVKNNDICLMCRDLIVIYESLLIDLILMLFIALLINFSLSTSAP